MLRNLAALGVFALILSIQISVIRDGSTGKRSSADRHYSRTMAGRQGTAVVLDAHSGRVLAAYHLDVAARRVVHPGSSIKPFTLMALLAARQSKRTDRADVQALGCRSAATSWIALIR